LHALDLALDLAGRLAVCFDRFFTSEATTANPLPAPPARAASIVAFKASRFVCEATLRMNSRTLSIFEATAVRFSTATSACATC
jgi:hypothetical protein